MFPLLRLLLLLSSLFPAALLRRGSSFGFVYPDPANATETRTSLYVGLIQSYDPTKLDDQLDSVGTVVGAELAVQHINANDTILQGYTLHYNFINSQCNGYQGAAAMIHQVLNSPTKIGMIGAGCSPSTQNAALMSQFYNLTQISCIATSPTLAQRDVYRRYIQLLPPEFETAEGFYSIISHYGWKRVGVILEEEDLFEKTFIVLRDKLTQDGIDVQSYKLHFDDLQYYKEDVFDFDNFNGIRIFIIISYEAFAVPMLCEAYNRGLWYPRYHFLLNGWYSQEWWKKDVKYSNCSGKQIEEALQHSLSVDILPDAKVLGKDWPAVDLGITNEEFYSAENKHIANPPPPLRINTTNFLSQYCYDATWAFAFALNQTIYDLATNDTLNEDAKAASCVNNTNTSERFQIEDFDYSNYVIADLMMANWEKVSFVGVTGRVSFVNGLRELLRIQVAQFLEDGGKFDERDVGHLEKDTNFSIASIEEYIDWKYGVPHDGSVDEVVDPIHISVTVIFTLLGVIGIGFAVVCLFLNYCLREKLIIKLSSPTLNYLIGIGAILLYINMILVVVRLEEEHQELASYLCCITPWFTAIGYSLCYGTILVKMFRTWYIFNNPVAKKKKFHDWMLITAVLCLVVLDVVIMTVYTSLEATTGGGASRVPNREQHKTVSGPQEVETLHYVYVCNSIERQVTLGVLYGYKALFQISALFLSFATWKVQIHGLDDSKPIIIATYVTSLVLAVVIVSTYTLTEYVNVYAAVFDFGFFVGTTVILCLVFMTKMYSLAKDPEGKNVFVTKSGDVRDYRSSSKMESQSEAVDGLRQITVDGEDFGLQSLAGKDVTTDSEHSEQKSPKGVQFKQQ